MGSNPVGGGGGGVKNKYCYFILITPFPHLYLTQVTNHLFPDEFHIKSQSLAAFS